MEDRTEHYLCNAISMLDLVVRQMATRACTLLVQLARLVVLDFSVVVKAVWVVAMVSIKTTL